MGDAEKIKIGISIGDVNGIGPEVVIKTLSDSRITDFCTPVIFGSQNVLNYHRKTLKTGHFNLHLLKTAEKFKSGQVNLVDALNGEVKIQLGAIDSEAGKAAYESLKSACDALENKAIDALVTAPIHKASIQSEDFKFPGHTEYLSHRFGKKEGLMILTGERCRVALATGHVPVNQVSAHLNQEMLVEKLRVLNHSLIQDFGIRKPRIALMGLNPHAGDGGLIGNEENSILLPAMETAKEKGVLVFGPYPADGFWGRGMGMKFDAVLAMYHDQGLIPFKTLESDKGVNFTAGLPVIRTSPDHGTGFDIAGQNQASPDSFRQALFLAIDIARKRRENQDLQKNQMVNLDRENN